MKPLSTSISTFEDLIREGCLYVDKTEYLHRLIAAPKGQYFFARPRRFGKSLTLSTLKAIFQGKRALFKGLAIDEMAYDWKKHPVIHLNMGSAAAENAEELREILTGCISEQADVHQLTIARNLPSEMFLSLVRKLSENDCKVVILVDEYDKPLLNHIGQESVKEIQSVLKSFYSVIKTTESCQRFAFITGVSKFSKVSIFSDLNNLTDLTMTAPEATLLGYTQEELESNFGGYIDALAQALGLSQEQCLARVKEWYNGYRFHGHSQTLYNPVSVMKCFQNNEIHNYWFETGTPTFLMELLAKKAVKLDHLEVPQELFSVYEPNQAAILPLLFQTGYLTIAQAWHDGVQTKYRLDFPNTEVAFSFSFAASLALSHADSEDFSRAVDEVVAAFRAGEIDAALTAMRIFFAKIPNRLVVDNEKYYQTIFYVIFRMLGVYIKCEVSTFTGYIDAVVMNARSIYVIEFKLNDTAEAALQQIEEKAYALPYAHDGRCLYKVGVEFSRETRNIARWLVRE
jgi:hypothetical protein